MVILHMAALFSMNRYVPLIVKKPAQNERKTVDALVEQIQIPATILDFAAGLGTNTYTGVYAEGKKLVECGKNTYYDVRNGACIRLMH
jgi:arylsulfatase A-like enzyme